MGIASELEQYRAETYTIKEPETIEWLNKNLKDHDVFYDVGANIGLYSLYAAKLRPYCIVYAFEPESQNFARLCSNIARNNITNIIPCNFPLARFETFDYFHVGEMQAGAALHSFGQRNECRGDCETTPIKQGCLSVTLDALVEKYNLPVPQLLKIDVDGNEADIIEGGKTTLGSKSVRTILIELNKGEENNVNGSLKRFKVLGYTLEKTGPLSRVNDIPSQNHIFQHDIEHY